MPWQWPKLNWTASDKIQQHDINRIEGNIRHIEEITRTPVDSAIPSASGKLSEILNSFSAVLKLIVGGLHWHTQPGKTLEDLHNHIGVGGDQHALATTSVAGFMSGPDKDKLTNFQPRYHARGKWTDTTTVIAAGKTYITLINPGFVVTGGKVHIKAPGIREGVTLVAANDSSDSVYIGLSDADGRVGMYPFVDPATAVKFGTDISLYSVSIWSGVLRVVFENRGTVDNTLNVSNLQWEAWG